MSNEWLSMQTNPFDLFESFFGGSMGGMGGMGSMGGMGGGFGSRQYSTTVQGDDIR
jgi:molecular chaperone DnaJ